MVGPVVLLTAALAVVAGSVAFACTNLATVSLSTNAAHAGDTVTIVGTSFPVARNRDLPPTPVQVHWGQVDGPVVAEAVPDRTGTVSATFTVPEVPPGDVVIVVTQRRALEPVDGGEGGPVQYVDEPGTPARTSIRVLAPGERAPSRPLAGQVVAAGDGGSTTTLIVLTAVFGAIALSLFGGGFIAFLHQVRSRNLRAQPWPPQWPPGW
jgi:hypothetical protein